MYCARAGRTRASTRSPPNSGSRCGSTGRSPGGCCAREPGPHRRSWPQALRDLPVAGHTVRAARFTSGFDPHAVRPFAHGVGRRDLLIIPPRTETATAERVMTAAADPALHLTASALLQDAGGGTGRGRVTSTEQHRAPADDARPSRFRLAITCTGHQHRAGPAGQDMPRPGVWPRPWWSGWPRRGSDPPCVRVGVPIGVPYESSTCCPTKPNRRAGHAS
ncbi:DUF5994 family protein [Streptomyces sp. NPDC101152]|uniref:DUF5994 family protein n=1 Tax=Streptomyces sp. NPDC101152 TaxID=3366116 RepID=UPI0037FE6A06